MALTIKEALKFGGLFGASVVAGKTGLDEVIESISVLEIAESEISRWVLKNQLYITSFYAIHDNVERQKEVINTLIEYGCCGLVLCYVGTWVEQIDKDIIRLCDEAGFPLIQARADVSYIEILNPIINLLHEENTQSVTVNDYSGIRNDFLSLIVNEENIDVVLGQMNQRLGRKISYYDTYGKMLFSDRGEKAVCDEEEYLQHYFNHVLYACSRNGYTLEKIQGEERLIVLIRSQKNLFGLFITNYEGEDMVNMEQEFINPLVVAGALLLRRRSHRVNLREKAIEEYVTDLLVWNFPTDEKAIERGMELGLTITDKDSVILININSIQSMKKVKVQQEMQQYVKRVILERIERYIKLYDSGNWLAFRSDTIILFLNNKDNKMDMQDVQKHILNIFAEKPNLSISVGVSNRFGKETELPEAYRQAFQAAVLGREHYGENKMVFYDSVYFFSKLRQLKEEASTQMICSRYLEPVVNYDKMHGTELTMTLQSLIESNGNTQKAAERLYVHKNTILQRKERIIELLGFSPFEMPHLLNFLIVFVIMKEK